ncbi:MAG: phenylalanine--tRNA ligase subunit beta [Candidatus Thermofonsia Clade 3 bacterium]|jgi:phenylalanyl-tRNA synthetase beta chain|uniref:Phenylalanine--tRNA ligase beta subunit n=1 Tax=Candidatus Thermofonsia Clade 3 bacterium TaxID=2364212 RepID=A0A2M8QC07_9CHLR|nr:phenylalanine--tRNA ligase subunit beta [Candidatus Roseilinea sp. NK_OTU-006]PJF47322.1 MAG: phenylalanine--tRNA ligase subunit beta [Candidatus Thermofonsia Clade 3 bacterium]
MRVPISWLREYVEVTLPVDVLAEKLTLAGFEVEHIEYVGLPGSELPWDRDKIFVGQLLQVERHPNADRLLLATVDYGTGQPITVVTGAPNIRPGDSGQKVVLALKGARLYDGHKAGKVIMTLKAATLRGIKNDSMVCSEKELGLSDEHEGILILPDDAPVGAPLADYLGDVVLEVAILPSTARAASIIGIAREVAALTGQTVRYPPMDFTAEGEPIEGELRIEIRNSRLNPRFTAGVIRGVTIGPSPFWMQRRLALCGMRAINNIVDISNYVMLEFGQPTHAFDLDAVRIGPSGIRTITTRLAEPGEALTTLDGQTRDLQPTDILVCDEIGPLSLAGVMGGADSEVKESTRNVLFEAASWDNISIRKTARYHNLHSEASYRFSRGVHPALAMVAQRRGLHLLQRYAGGVISRGILDAYPSPAPPVRIALHPERVNKLLGVEMTVEEMTRILRLLEFEVKAEGERAQPGVAAPAPQPPRLMVTAPEHRLDIEGEHDLIEEIARIYGYDRIPETLMADALPPIHGNPALDFEERVRDLLVGAGLQEIVTYRLTSPEQEARIYAPNTPADHRPYVMLANPINPERTAMRHTLVSGALEVLTANLRHHARVAIFEIGAVFLPGSEGGLPEEQPRLAIAMSGARAEPSWRTHNADGAPVMDFYDLKGVVESLLDGLHLGEVTYEPTTHPTYYPGRTAAVRACDASGMLLGLLGELHPRVRDAWGLPADRPVLIADFDLEALRHAAARDYAIRDLPRFPATIEDLAIVVDEAVPAAAVARTIRQAGGALLRDLRLFDVYRGEQIGSGKKSLAYSLTYQAEDRTLTDKDVETLRAKIIRALEGQLGATVRR